MPVENAKERTLFRKWRNYAAVYFPYNCPMQYISDLKGGLVTMVLEPKFGAIVIRNFVAVEKRRPSHVWF